MELEVWPIRPKTTQNKSLGAIEQTHFGLLNKLNASGLGLTFRSQFLADVGRKPNVDGPETGPNWAGLSARPAWDRFSVHPNYVYGQSGPKLPLQPGPGP